jgi:hypothetical protein
MKKLLIVIVMTVLAVEGPVLAGPLVMSQVSGNANWVVHANQQQFKKTNIGQLIRTEMVTLGIEENLSNFAQIFSFHPLDDVRDVTVYGSGQDREKVVVLVDGFFDKERILSILRVNPEYKVIKHGNTVLHQWIDENQQDPNLLMYGCFYRDDLIVMGAGLEAVKLEVDVLNGSAKNAAGNIFNQPALDAKGAFIQAVGNHVGEMLGQDPDAAAFRQTDLLGLAVGEVEGKFYIESSLTAKSDEAAQALTQMLEGILAFISMPNEEQPKLAELAKKIKINCEEKTIKVKFESKPEVVVQFLKEEWKKNQQKETKTQ